MPMNPVRGRVSRPLHAGLTDNEPRWFPLKKNEKMKIT